ncbi:Lipoprotein [Sulfitobacter noctilucicola]|uniref:LPS-assembly lipoprotein n=1 Tax=Sulfitobacter noctilucicola TaxID=1342301 RepID=A0A7W6M4L1_9RHOB|nr:LPS assembly lipoprotein LptE [Sulfitobacter noctilucicola]KIN63125.1 Lipoprotein [Sulfitobacter noctilucicola]MBB4172348.1 LPS-assembly lipoprotein [Sulfitobacter noctilucicola]
MSLLNRRSLLLAPLALVACGFEPVYGPGGTGTLLQNRVLVDAPGSQDSYLLTREIEERLGRSNEPAYALSLDLRLSTAQLAIDREGDTGRFNRVANINYSLRDVATGQIVTSGSVENFVGYSATGTTVETLAGELDAQKRLMVIMAEQIVSRLYAADLNT